MRNKILSLDRIYKQGIMLLLDILLILFSLWLAFFLRFGEVFSEYMILILWMFVLIPVISLPLFIRLGLYRSVLQYTGIKVIITSFKATTITCFVATFYMFFFQESDLPRSIILIFWFISNMIVLLSRFLLQGIIYSWDSSINQRKATIIYGAGGAGVQLADSLKKSVDYVPVAFIDDDKDKQGTIINFIQIFSFNQLEYLIKKYNLKLILIAIPSLTISKKKIILDKLSKYPLEVKVIPSVDDIVNGDVSIETLKHVQVIDILGRDPVNPKKDLLSKNILNKNILVTGGGGSIGSELCRQILHFNPSKVIIMDNSEFSLYSIHQSLIDHTAIEVIPILASVTNLKKVDAVVKDYDVETIYHAAAYKHVPMMEINISEGVYNNVMGTYNVAQAALRNDVKNMILVSTDKAVRPKNVMGASKRFSELILQSFAKLKHNTCFSIVRFGNVLDSAGSVVPLFREQTRKGGPVTVTHPEVTRYFMSIPEASQLVLQAGSMAEGGEVFVLDMGNPIKILDLAYRMIHLTGLTPIDDLNPNGDIEISFTGLRAGEKLYEELIIGQEALPSDHVRIMKVNEHSLDLAEIKDVIKLICEYREEQNDSEIKSILFGSIKNEY